MLNFVADKRRSRVGVARVWLALITVVAFALTGLVATQSAQAAASNVVISGQVTSQSANTAVAGVQVSLIDTMHNLSPVSTTTASNGTYSLVVPGTSKARLEVRDASYVYLNSYVNINASADLVKNVSLSAHPNHSLHGVVINKDTREPIPGVQVWGWSQESFGLNQVPMVNTNDLGEFVLQHIPGTTVSINANSDGYKPYGSNPAVDSEGSLPITVELSPKVLVEGVATISGRVFKPDGSVYAGEGSWPNVSAYPRGGNGQSYWASFDSQGTYTISNGNDPLPDGTYDVFATAPFGVGGQAPARVNKVVITGGVGVAGVDLRYPVTVPRSFTGKVVDQFNAPVAGVTVHSSSDYWLTANNSSGINATDVVTDADGNFRVTDLISTANIHVSLTDNPSRGDGLLYLDDTNVSYATDSGMSINADGSTFKKLTMTKLVANGSLHLHVVDFSGQPLEGVQLSVSTVGSNQSGININLPWDSSRSDSAGNIDIDSIPRSVLRISLNNSFSKIVDLSTISSFTRTFTLGNPLAKTYTGGVKGVLSAQNSDGTTVPLAGIEMNISPMFGGNDWRFVTTDSFGRFKVTGLSPGSYSIWATTFDGSNRTYKYPDWSTTQFVVTDGMVTKDLKLDKIASGKRSVTGQIVDSGNSNSPIEGASVQLYGTDGSQVYQTTVSDADGHFHFEGLPSGKYQVSAYWASGSSSTYEDSWPMTNVDLGSATSVNNLQLAFHSVRGGTAQFAGIFRDSQTNNVIADVNLVLKRVNGGLANQTATTASDGSFSFDGLPEGRYTMSASADRYKSADIALDLDRGESMRYRGKLVADNPVNTQAVNVGTATISGQLRDSSYNKLYLSGYVNLSDINDRGHYYSMDADSEGQFVIPKVAPGTYTLSANASGSNLVSKSVLVTVLPGQSTLNLDVIFTNPGVISGTVKTASGRLWGSGYGYGGGNWRDVVQVDLIDANGVCASSASANAQSGAYTLTGIADGTYTLRATQVSTCHGGDSAQIKAEFLPSYATAEKAVTIKAGQILSGQNLVVATGGAIFGSVGIGSSNSSVVPLVDHILTVKIYQYSNNRLVQTNWLNPYFGNSNFGFNGLAPGDYKLEFIDMWTGNKALTTTYSGGAKTLASAAKVTVVADKITELPIIAMSIKKPSDDEAFTSLGLTADLADEISAPDTLIVGDQETIFVGKEYAGQWVSTWVLPEASVGTVGAEADPLANDWVQVSTTGEVVVQVSKDAPVGDNQALVVQDAENKPVGYTSVDISGLPSEPTNVQVQQSGIGALSVTWDKPASQFESVTGYELQYRTSESSTWTTLSNQSANSKSKKLTSLDASTSYVVRLRAKTALPDVFGKYSVPVSATTISGVPVAPSGVKAVVVSKSQVDVSWGLPAGAGLNGATLTGVRLQYRVKGVDAWSDAPLLGAAVVKASVKGLTAGSIYEFRVSGVIAGGLGETSSVVSAGPGVPNAPTGVKLTAVSSTQVKVDWSDPAISAGTTITNYVVQYKASLVDTWESAPAVAANVKTKTLTLSAATAYDFRVFAKSVDADGPTSSVLTMATPDGIPDAPSAVKTAVISKTQVDVSWTLPAGAGLNGATLTGLRLQYRIQGTDAWTTYAPALSATAAKASVTGLTAANVYEFRVTGLIASGDGDTSAIVSASPGIPNAPTGVKAVPTSSTAVKVDWTAPAASAGTTITTYVIQYKTSTSDAWLSATPEASALLRTQTIAVSAATSYDFRVLAKSSSVMGPVSNTATIATPDGVPDAPSSVKAIASTKSQVDVSWVLPSAGGLNGATLTGLRLEYRAAGVEAWTRYTALGSSTTRASVTGLVSGTSYEFRVSGLTASGVGDTSAIVSAAPGRPNAPTGVVAAAKSTSGPDQAAVTVSWVKPVADVATVSRTGYSIQYQPESCESCWTSVAVPGASTLSYKLSGLNAGVVYQIRVASVASTGTSDGVMTSVRTFSGVPVAPSGVKAVVVSKSQVDVSWGLPAGAGLNGATLTGVRLQYRVKGVDAWSDAPLLGAAVVKASVKGLTAGSIYEFRVSGVIAGGLGETSSVVSAGPGVPNAPTGVKLTALSSTQVKVDWSDPAVSAGTTITNYVVQYKASSADTWESALAVAANVKTKTLTLSAATAYDFRVFAKSIDADGPTTSVLTMATPDGIPDAPSAVKAAVISKTQVDVSWTLPTGAGLNGATLTGLRLQYRLQGADSWTTYASALSATAAKASVTGLSAANVYEFRVTGLIASGDGDTSAIVSASPGIPNAPTGVLVAAKSTTGVDQATITVKWDSLLTSGMNGATLTGYVVEYRLGGTDSWVANPAVSAVAKTVDIGGLRADSWYEIRARARTALGLGATSVSLFVLTKEAP